MSEEAKQCTGPCGRTLPYSAYAKQAANRTGRKPRCRECEAAARRARADVDPVGDAFKRGYRAGAAEALESAPEPLPDDFLSDLIRLCHPDRHPPERGELATRVSAAVNALRKR